jgi:hypothetical protein
MTSSKIIKSTKMHKCLLCHDDINKHQKYINCSKLSEPCFFHIECFEPYLKIITTDNSKINHFEKTNNILCPICEYDITDSQFMKTTIELYSKYSKTREELVKIIAEIECNKKLSKMIQQHNCKENNLEIIKKELDNLTTLKCPNCSLAFIDFEGCLALTCHFCKTEFCGLCLKIHLWPCVDGHEMVLSHKFNYHDKLKYGINGVFMNMDKWNNIWSNKIKLDILTEYFCISLRKEIVWENYNDIKIYIIKNNLLSDENIQILEMKIFSHNMSGTHLVRIPNIFYILYSTKKNIRFEEAFKHFDFTKDMRISVGILIINKVKLEYPGWKPIKNLVPGEDFQAVNYPPEFSSLITEVIYEWGKEKSIW